MTNKNIKCGKCRTTKMLQAGSAGRVRLKLIVRDFSDLQPQEVITILATVIGESHSYWLEKSAVPYLKQTVHKTSELLFYQNENRHNTRKS